MNALGLEMVDLFAHNGPSTRGAAKKATKKRGDKGKTMTTDELPDGTYWPAFRTASLAPRAKRLNAGVCLWL